MGQEFLGWKYHVRANDRFGRGRGRKRLMGLICAALALAHVPRAVAADEARLTRFEQALDALRLQHRVPGLSAAIVRNQQIIRGKGLRISGYREPNPGCA